MATPWPQVEASAAYKALTPDQQTEAKAQYFSQVVAPRVPTGDLTKAWWQFIGQAGDVSQISASMPQSLQSLVAGRIRADAQAASTPEAKAARFQQINAANVAAQNPALTALQGVGKSFVDTGRGLGELVGAESPQDVANARQADQALMGTRAGQLGYGGGVAAQIVGGAALGGLAAGAPALAGLTAASPTLAGSLAGGALTGAAYGDIAPYATTGEHVGNIAVGTLAGPAIRGVIGGARLLGRGGQALLQRYLAPDAVAATRVGRALAEDNAIPSMVRAGNDPVAGVKPTLAQVLQTPKAVQLERAARNNPISGPDIAAQDLQNSAARSQALQQSVLSPADELAARRARKANFAPIADALQNAGSVDVGPLRFEAQNLAQRGNNAMTRSAARKVLEFMDDNAIPVSSGRATNDVVATDKTAAGLQGALAASGKSRASAIDEVTGLPLNPDGTVTVYHHTSPAAASEIRKSGRLKSAAEPDVYVTTSSDPTIGYGESVVPVRVDPRKLQLDDEFPGGRVDFRIATGKPGGSVPVAVESDTVASGSSDAIGMRPSDLHTLQHDLGAIVKQANPEAINTAQALHELQPFKSAIVNTVDSIVPGYQDALRRYAQDSAPIRTSRTIGDLLNPTKATATDLNNEPVLTAARIKSVLSKEDRAPFKMTPKARQDLEDVQASIQSRNAAQRSIGPIGSPTEENRLNQLVNSGARHIGAATGSAVGFGLGGPVGGIVGALTGHGADLLDRYAQNRIAGSVGRLLMDPNASADALDRYLMLEGRRQAFDNALMPVGRYGGIAGLLASPTRAGGSQ